MKFINSNDANGYYKAFGLSPGATREEIKKSYRRLVKTLHPDHEGDEELFRFIVEIAGVLLDPESKSRYDSVPEKSMFLGEMEREELARSGVFDKEESFSCDRRQHWACLANSGFPVDESSDAWTELCREVSPAVGHRGKIRVGVIEGGRHWPCDPLTPWGVLNVGSRQQIFVVFQRGVKPNRLYALCAMIDWQNTLLNQIKNGWVTIQDEERTTWL